MPKQRSNRVIAYSRVSTAEQTVSGLGLSDQRAAIQTEASRRGWTDLTWTTDEGLSAKNLARPGLTAALAELEAGAASVLVVSKLDRLSRSLLDFCTLVDLGKRQGWQIVVLDSDVDTSTASGALMMNVLASFAEFERQLISQRTSAAMQQLKRQGVRLGRPRGMCPQVTARIVSERQGGMTLTAIAEGLNADGVATARGGSKWYASTIKAALTSAELDETAA